MTHINWVSKGSTYLASHRLRVQKPVTLINTYTDIKATISDRADLTADLNIFSKHFKTEEMYEDVLACKIKGIPTIMDVCDNHFQRDNSKHYIKMCEAVDQVTCNSKNMKVAIEAHTDRTAFVISDPIVFPYKEPSLFKSNGSYGPKVLWFGHSSNLEGLKRWLPNILCKVTVVSNQPLVHNKVDFIPWRPLLVEEMIKDFDIILIPSSGFTWANCKSPNRAVDTLWSGKTFITDDEDVYKDVLPFGYLVDKDGLQVHDVLNTLRTNPEEAKEKIIKGQQYLKDNLNDESVLEAWLDTFKQLNLIELETEMDDIRNLEDNEDRT